MLWRRLLHPDDHPLFRRTIRTARSSRATLVVMWAVPLSGLLVGCALWTLLPQFNIAVLLFMAMLPFSSGYVVVWVINISITIAREHERHTYEQLCLAPPGALGTNWAICAAILHRSDLLHWIDLLRRLIAAALLFILLMVLIVTALRLKIPDLLQFLRLFLDILALAAVLYIDHVQSVVLGSLIGMLLPVYRRNSVDVGVWAAATFLALQTMTLLATLITARVIPPGWSGAVSPILLTLLVLCLARESLIFAASRLLVYHLNGDLLEFSF